jgi:hypothetical protein
VNGLRLQRVGDDRVRISRVDRVTAHCLLEVPGILPQAGPGAAKERLFPGVSDQDSQLNEEWRQFVTPELEHLFAAARETLAQDTAGLADQSEVTIPLSHCEAWISAINQARLVLGAQHEVTEEDMDDMSFTDPADPKQQALFRVHVLGHVVGVFVEFLNGPEEPPTEDGRGGEI